MKLSQLTVVQRVVLSIAVPSVALVLSWPVHCSRHLGLVIEGKRDDIVFREFLRDQPWFWATTIAATAAWLCVLWGSKDSRSKTSGTLSNAVQQQASAPSGDRD